MTPDPAFFVDLAIVFLAYVLGGLLVGPFTPGPTVSDFHTFELFAEIGVILLMFSIGIEFSLSDLLRVKWVALLGGPLGILLSTALGMGVGALMGWPPLQGLAAVASPSARRHPCRARGRAGSQAGRRAARPTSRAAD